METYSPELTVKQALSMFFEKHNLGEDGGMSKSWAHLKVGNFYIPFPNTEARKKALIYHDIHHLVTGYNGNWKGEVAISAWEVSSGCGKYSAAWALDLAGFALGLFIYPERVFKAFIRGRRTQNLYHSPLSREQLVNMQISEIQALLKLDSANTENAKASEILAFIGWSAISLLINFILFVAPYILLPWWLLK